MKLQTLFESIAVSYAILSGLYLWTMLTGGFKEDGKKSNTSTEKTEKARTMLAVGTFVIWGIVAAALLLWLSSYLILRLIGVHIPPN